MLRDAQAFGDKLGKLDGFGDTGKHVIEVVQGKIAESKAPSKDPPLEDSTAGEIQDKKDSSSTSDEQTAE